MIFCFNESFLILRPSSQHAKTAADKLEAYFQLPIRGYGFSRIMYIILDVSIWPLLISSSREQLLITDDYLMRKQTGQNIDFSF